MVMVRVMAIAVVVGAGGWRKRAKGSGRREERRRSEWGVAPGVGAPARWPAWQWRGFEALASAKDLLATASTVSPRVIFLYSEGWSVQFEKHGCQVTLPPGWVSTLPAYAPGGLASCLGWLVMDEPG